MTQNLGKGMHVWKGTAWQVKTLQIEVKGGSLNTKRQNKSKFPFGEMERCPQANGRVLSRGTWEENMVRGCWKVACRQLC